MVVRIKKSARHKRRFPKKHTKKYNLRGGALTPEVEVLLRILSKIITLGSLGLITYCTAMPLIEVISGLLASAGLDTMTTAFYKLIWVNLSSTMTSLYTAAGSAGAAAVHGVNVVANTANLCAAVHATVRLANPIYYFALSGIQHFIEIMKSPLKFNQTIQTFLNEHNGIIRNFLGDYQSLLRNARRGVEVTQENMVKMYEKLTVLMSHLSDTFEEALPKRSEAEKEAQKSNLKVLENCEEFVFQILLLGAKGLSGAYGVGSRLTPKAFEAFEAVGSCAIGAKNYAKEWIHYFKTKCGDTTQYIKPQKQETKQSQKRKREESPPLEELAPVMMKAEDSLATEADSQEFFSGEESQDYLDAEDPRSPSPSPSPLTDEQKEIVTILSSIKAELESKIKKRVNGTECPRGRSAPPSFEPHLELPPIKVPRRSSLGNGNPSAFGNPHMETIQESPRQKTKTEGGRKTRKRVHFKKRRRTRKQ